MPRVTAPGAGGDPIPSEDFVPFAGPGIASSPVKTLRMTRTSGHNSNTSTPSKTASPRKVSPSKASPNSNHQQQQQPGSPKVMMTLVNENNKRTLRSSSRGRGEPEAKKTKASDSTCVSHGDIIDLVASDESNDPTDSPMFPPVGPGEPPFCKDNTTAKVSIPNARGDGHTKYYVVIDGYNPGIYRSAEEAWEQIDGYSKSFVKTFNNESDASFFLQTYRNMQSSTITQSTVINSAAETRSKSNSNFNFQPSCHGVFGASKGHADIYTDGSFETRTRKAGIGVWWGKGDPRNVSEQLDGPTSSNRAEICAAIRGIRDAKAQGYSSVAIHTDSQAMIDSIRQWVDDHISKRQRKKIDGVLEQDLLNLVDAITGLAITWVKVKGHSGVAGNEGADSLAKNGRCKPKKGQNSAAGKTVPKRHRFPPKSRQNPDRGESPSTFWQSSFNLDAFAPPGYSSHPVTMTNPSPPPYPYPYY